MKVLKKIAKWSLLLCLLLGLVFASLWLLNAPQGLSEKSQSKARLDHSEFSVDSMDLEIIDLSRSTPALGDFEGDDKRVLKGTVWFPEGTSSGHPLLVYSHGFGGYYRDSMFIVKHLVRNGYVVAAVDFPLSNMLSPAGVPQLVDVVNQPGDVSAVIDQVLALNNDSGSRIHQRIDPNNVGTFGLSLGGLTVALASFHPDLKDDRIKAAVMLAPPLESFSEQFYAGNREVNSLLISGSLDRVVPQTENAVQVEARHPRGWFIDLDKGTHLGFADVGNYARWTENPDNLGCAFMNRMLSKLDLPERWDAVVPNTGGVLRETVVGQPCPELPGKSMNGLKQQWLTRIAVGSFFDMHLRSGYRAASATEFFIDKLSLENPALSLTSPR